MPKLSDLPFEIIMMIYSMIPDQYSAREILVAVDSKRRDALICPSVASTKMYRSFRNKNTEDRMALVNFKGICKAYSELPIRKYFGRVPIGIHAETPLEAMEQVCDLIELLLCYPEMARDVRQLYFCVDERCHEKIELDPDIQDRLTSAARSSAIKMNLRWSPPHRSDSIEDILEDSCDSEIFLGLGLVLLIRLLPNVEHLVLAAHVLTYNWITRMFPAFEGPVVPSPLSLRSFVYQGDDPTLGKCRLLKLCQDTGIFQHGSELFVQDIQVDLWRNSDTSEIVQFRNLTSLVLSNVEIELETLERMIDGITRLNKFILTNRNKENSMRSVPAACDVVDALENHADSLETLCLGYDKCPDNFHRPVKSLAHFTALENLWIRATEFRYVPTPSSSTEPADMDAITLTEPDLSGTERSAFMTLPGGLKRFHLASAARYVGSDLDFIFRRLEGGDSSVRFPDDFRLDGRHGASSYYINRLRWLGVNVGDEVDRRPDSW